MSERARILKNIIFKELKTKMHDLDRLLQTPSHQTGVECFLWFPLWRNHPEVMLDNPHSPHTWGRSQWPHIFAEKVVQSTGATRVQSQKRPPYLQSTQDTISRSTSKRCLKVGKSTFLYGEGVVGRCCHKKSKYETGSGSLWDFQDFGYHLNLSV